MEEIWVCFWPAEGKETLKAKGIGGKTEERKWWETEVISGLKDEEWSLIEYPYGMYVGRRLSIL